jgi:hypothetical protein
MMETLSAAVYMLKQRRSKMSIYRYKYVLLVVVLACGIPGSTPAQHSLGSAEHHPGKAPKKGGKISVPKVLLEVFQAHIAAQEAVLKAKENQAKTQLKLYREVGKFLHTGPSEKMNQIIATALSQVLERHQAVLYTSLIGDSNVYFQEKVSLQEVRQFENAAASRLKDVQAKLHGTKVNVVVIGEGNKLRPFK